MLSHLISIVILSVVPLIRNASSNVLDDNIQHDIKRDHKRKFYELLDADIAERQLKGEIPNKYWMLNAEQYEDLIKKIESGLSGIVDKAEYNKRHTIINNYEVLEICDIKKIIKKRKDEND